MHAWIDPLSTVLALLAVVLGVVAILQANGTIRRLKSPPLEPKREIPGAVVAGYIAGEDIGEGQAVVMRGGRVWRA